MSKAKKKKKNPRSEEEKQQIVNQFLPRVKYYASKYAFAVPAGLSYEDLVSAGIIGLLEAAERYDESHQASLSTFVDFRIRGAILDEIRSMQWGSKEARKKVDEIRNAFSTLEKKLGRQVDDTEVAEFLNMPVEELHKTMSTVNTLNMLNLDEISAGLLKEGEHFDIYDCIKGSEKDIIEDLNLKETVNILSTAIEALPEKERMVITLYYYEEMNMREIGQILGVTESRVCQLHGKAMITLRNALQKTKQKDV